ncbi:4127_t:CDS:2, partial [Ambispora gerdemannii]
MAFKNFHATVIQRADRNYKKRPESLATQVWNVTRQEHVLHFDEWITTLNKGNIYQTYNAEYNVAK